MRGYRSVKRTNPPCLRQRSMKNPRSALSAAPAVGWYLLPPRLHPAARSDPPHAPGPAISSWLKPERAGEKERFTALLQQSSCPRSTATKTLLPLLPQVTRVCYQFGNDRDKKYQVLRSHFQAQWLLWTESGMQQVRRNKPLALNWH